jgi:hypothetical protein
MTSPSAKAVQHEDFRVLASDPVRLPRRKLWDRVRKHLAFLRSVVSLGRATPSREFERQYEHERGAYGR